MYDQWCKNREKSVSFSVHISDELAVVLGVGEYSGGTLPLPFRMRGAYGIWLYMYGV